MLRTISGIVLGIVIGVACVWLIQFIGHSIFPIDPIRDLQDRAEVARIIAAAPAGALAFVALAWFGGAAVGGAVAGRIAQRSWAAWVVAALILIAAVANIVMFPHPMWMNVAAFVAPLLGGLVGARLAGEPARRAEVVREPAGHA